MVEVMMEKDVRRDSEAKQKSSGATAGPDLTPFEGVADDLTRLFKLLADQTRLRILYALTRRPEMHVRALCEMLDQSQPAVSHHLALLRAAGLIARRREGKHNYYRLVSDRFEEVGETVFKMLAPEQRPVRLTNLVVALEPR
jgi:ArsR family transcriptional regulator